MIKSTISTFKELDQKNGLADALTFYWMLDDGIIYHKDNALSATVEFFGPDLDSATEASVNILTAQVHRVLSQLYEGWMIETNLISSKDNGYDRSPHKRDIVSTLIDREREKTFLKNGQVFKSKFYYTFTYIQCDQRLDNLKSFIFSSEKIEKADEEVIGIDDKLINKFKDELKKMMSLFRTFGIHVQQLQDGDLFKYLYDCVNCTDSPDRAPHKGFDKKSLTHRLFLDYALGKSPSRMSAELNVDGKHVRCISLDDVPNEYYPTILHELSLLNCEFRWSCRFVYMSLERALKLFKSRHFMWDMKKSGGFKKSMGRMMGSENIELDQHAVDMANEVKIAETRARYGTRYGYMNSTVVIWDEDLEQVNEKINKINNLLRAKGFMPRVEKTNTPQAFLGSIPSHGGYNARCIPAELELYVNHIPTTGIYQGHKKSTFPVLKDYPALFETVTNYGDRRFSFNFHKGTVGHTFIVGPVGKGKTVFQANAISQWLSKYPNARVIGTDSNNSLLATCITHGGKYIDINRDMVKMNPLHGCDDKAYRVNKLLPWLINIFELTADRKSNDVEKEVIATALEETSSLPRTHQNFTSFVSQINDTPCKTTFSTFVMMLPNEIFDGEDDTNLFDEQFILYDKDPIKSTGESVARSLIDYMFDSMIASVARNPTPTLLILSEANYELRNEYMRSKLLDTLETKARHNQIAIIFDFQSPDTMNYFGDASVIKTNIATQVWLPNAQVVADPDINTSYKNVGLNDRELELIGNAIPNCEYYIKQEDGSKLINFAIGPISLAFTALESKDKYLIEKLIEMYDFEDDNWAYEWLKCRGVSYEA